ncbi:MAG: DegT/DnrJ/EryC1/StrS family aminotransferase [Synergistaceae bacterium]|jgi:dTDP-4-amino-4,6-dideoxygalactose transaminase|nr:DegT/DnrJ/EryC1/StrS family aminotransferase [Synergistaceae bacterium]
MAAQTRKGDASGRGNSDGYKVSFPARMYAYNDEEIAAVVNVMKNSECQTQGENMARFESDFKTYTGANHAFAVDNATNALRIAATLCRFKQGDEVIIPAYTFCATALPFAAEGAKIVWVDMDDTWNADPDDIEKKITKRTKALVVVHLLGMPCEMEKIMKIARERNLIVVEDCAQAPGARIGDRHVGTFGDFGCFSFHGAKNMTTLGEGSMLTVRDDDMAKLVPGVRHNGVRGYEGERERYWVPAMSLVDFDIDGVWPHNFSMGEAQCALGSALLKRLDNINGILHEQGMKLRAMFEDTPEITYNRIPEGFFHIHHQCIYHFEGANGKNRDDLLDITTTKYGIRNIVQYYPLYRYPIFKKAGFGEADCPKLEKWWDNSFSFPWWCGVPDETLSYMADSIKAAIEEFKKA